MIDKNSIHKKKKKNVYLKQEIRVITKPEHFCFLDFNEFEN